MRLRRNRRAITEPYRSEAGPIAAVLSEARPYLPTDAEMERMALKLGILPDGHYRPTPWTQRWFAPAPRPSWWRRLLTRRGA